MQNQSNYKVIKWEEERLENEKLIENISEYPINLYDGYKDHSRLPTAEVGLRKRDDFSNIRGHGRSITRKEKQRRKLNTQQNFYRARDTLTGTRKGTNTPANNQQNIIDLDIGGLINLDPNRRILAKKARMMSSGYYLIEISRTDKTFYIAALK